MAAWIQGNPGNGGNTHRTSLPVSVDARTHPEVTE